MADPEVTSLAALQALPAEGSTGGAAPTTDALAIQARHDFAEAWNHPLWKKLRTMAKEDRGYYVGGLGQWSVDGSTADAEALQTAGRPVLSFNHVQRFIDLLAGYEAQNRYDPQAKPQGQDDPEDAETWSWLLKFYADQLELQDALADQFEEGLIEGCHALQLGVEWEDPLHGTITKTLLRGGEEVLWDPYAKEYDLSDARYCIVFKRPFLPTLLAEYPEDAEDIRAALGQVGEAFELKETTVTLPTPDGYGSVRGHPILDTEIEKLFYDREQNTLLLMEYWYQRLESEWVVVDYAASRVIEAQDDASGELVPFTKATASSVAAADPNTLEAYERRVRVIDMAVVLPATYHILEEGNPHENDRRAYPVIPFVARRKGDDFYGVVRNLKDPQRLENKRISQAMEILGKLASLRQYFEEGSVDPRILTDPHSTAPVAVKRGMQPPGYLHPPIADLIAVLTNMGRLMEALMPQITGLNPSLIGYQEGGAESGIALQRKIGQGQVIAAGFFARFRRTRKLVYQRLARRIQQVMTREEYVRLTNDLGEPVLVRVNPTEFRKLPEEQWKTRRAEMRAAQQPRVLRDLSKLKYDIVLADTPSTATARDALTLRLMDLLRSAPILIQAAPVTLEILVELMADLPRRAEIIQQLKAATQPPPQVGVGGAPSPSGAPPLSPTGAPAQPHVPPELAAAMRAATAGVG